LTTAPTVEEEILGRFQSLMRHVSDSHATDFLDVDVTMSQAKVLYLVSRRPGVSMSMLAAELSVGLPAASGLVDRLVAQGYLARQEDASDRRQQLVSVTDAGAMALDRMRELRVELLHRLIAGLDAGELKSLNEGLRALDREAQHLDDPSPAPPAQTDHPERTSA